MAPDRDHPMEGVAVTEMQELAKRAQELAALAPDRPEGSRAAVLFERLVESRFVVSVVGEFKRGKSTLINALVGEEVLPTGVLPLTAVATELRHGAASARVEYLDAHTQDIESASIAEYVTESANPENAKGVGRAVVSGPWALLQSGVALVDTPGIGSVYEHNSLTATAALLDADGAVLVLSADAPISDQDRGLLRMLAERRAPTFYVLNKIDHLRPDELVDVRAFVQGVLEEELGTTPRLFTVSARDALDRALGRPVDAGAQDEWAAFVAELERFIEADLVDARLATAGRELARLGASLGEAVALERAALAMDASDLAEKVKMFRAAVTAQRRAFDDDRTLLVRDVSRLSAASSQRLDRFATTRSAANRAAISDLAGTAPRRTLRHDLYEAIEDAVRRDVDVFRPREANRVERDWHQVATGFRQRTQDRVDTVRAAAGELFAVSLPPVEIPAVAHQREEFTYQFLRLEQLGDATLRRVGRIVPARIARPRAERWALGELARRYDQHAGRARWDLQQRLEKARIGLEGEMSAELAATIDGIVSATKRAEALLAEAEQTRERHEEQLEREGALAASLTSLDSE